MSELDALLAELRTKTDALAKSEPAAAEVKADEPKAEEPAAAAAEEPKADEPAAEEAGEEEAADEAEVTKSEGFEVTDADGNKLQAVDGFALLKAMQAEIDELKAKVEAAPAAADAETVAKSFSDATIRTDAQVETLAKSLAVALEEIKVVGEARKAAEDRAAALEAGLAAQGEVIKSLTDAVEKIGAQGAGRRSAVTLQERPSVVAKAEPAMTVGEIFAKATDLIRAGKLTGLDAARINARVNSGQGVPAEYQHLFAG